MNCHFRTERTRPTAELSEHAPIESETLNSFSSLKIFKINRMNDNLISIVQKNSRISPHNVLVGGYQNNHDVTNRQGKSSANILQLTSKHWDLFET